VSHRDHRSPPPDDRTRRRQGLTLLEVLAAFAIFAMVFTILVGASRSAVQSQGLALRKLEANLLADETLAEIESQVQQRTLPIIDDIATSEEPDENGFVVEVTGGELGLAEGPPGLSTALDEDASGGFGSLLATGIPEFAAFLMRYDIEVRWQDGGRERRVRRTTFAIDWEGAAAEFGGPLADALGTGEDRDLGGAGSDDGPGGGDGRDDDNDSRSRRRDDGGDAGGDDVERQREMMRRMLQEKM